jgi:hypothetical protein
MLIVPPLHAASASNLFDTLFGNVRPAPPPPPTLPPQIQANAPPASITSPMLVNPAPTHSGRSTVFCVRVCDGRYFPVTRHAGMSAAQACNSFCPASETKTFSGGSIDHAVASDGTRYPNLANAYLYRKQVVAGCTCNGRDAFGLAPLDAANDPTLRTGDIVATRGGFVAYQGRRGRNGDTNFTPIDSYSGLSADLRRRLSETTVMPAPAASKLPVDDHAAAASPEAGRQAQLVR